MKSEIVDASFPNKDCVQKLLGTPTPPSQANSEKLFAPLDAQRAKSRHDSFGASGDIGAGAGPGFGPGSGVGPGCGGGIGAPGSVVSEPPSLVRGV
jgi:hypothetical protein